MSVVNRYTKTVLPSTVDMSAISSAGGGFRAISGAADDLSVLIQKEEKARDSAWVTEQLLNAKKYKIDKDYELKEQRLDSPDGFGDELNVGFQKYDEEIAKSAPSAEAKRLFMEQSKQSNLNFYNSSRSWEHNQKIKNHDSSIKLSIQNLGDLAYRYAQDGLPLDDLYDNARDVAATGKALYSETQNKILEKKILASIDEGQLRGLVDNDPVKALQEIERGKFSSGQFPFEHAMNITEDIEGGFVASDGASGAPAIYGINRKWHEEAFDEAQKITDEQGEAAGKAYAREFYKREFWDKYDIDALVGGQRAVVFDGAVNHRTSFVKELVKAAQDGASPQELIQMRADEYLRLSKSPKHAPSFDGWMNRLQKISNAVNGSELPTEIISGFKSKAQTAVKKQYEEAKEIKFMQDVIAGDEYIDPSNSDHMKGLDKYYQKLEIDAQENPEMAVEFVSKYKAVPKELKSSVLGMINSGDNEMMKQGFNLITEMQSFTKSGFTQSQVEDADTYSSLIDAGYESDEALTVVKQTGSPEFEKIKEVNKERLKDVKYEAENVLKKFYGEGIFNLAPDISASAIDDYNEIFKQEFLRSGNAESAQLAAIRKIDRVYGTSKVMGGETLMAYPPEDYGHPSLSPSENKAWMREVLRKDLRALGYDAKKLADYELKPSYDSADLVRSGEPPVYFVLQNETNDYVRGKDGQPLLYYFDPQEGAKKADKNEEKERERKAKAYRRNVGLRDVLASGDYTTLEKNMARMGDMAADTVDGLGAIVDNIKGKIE